MKRVFSLLAIILFSVVAASAQNGLREVHAGLSRSREGERKVLSRQQIIKSPNSRVLRLGPRSTYLKEGLSTEEVITLLGQPVSVSERKDRETHFTTYTFARSGERILVAEFVNGVLVRTYTRTREAPAITGSLFVHDFFLDSRGIVDGNTDHREKQPMSTNDPSRSVQSV